MINKISTPLFTLFLLFFFNSCRSIKSPDLIGIDNFNLSRIDLKESVLTMNLNFYNTNNSKLKIKDAEGDAWLEGNMLGHFTMDTLIIIPANSNFTLPVQLEVDMSKVFRNSISLLLHPEVVVKIDGKAKVGKSGFFINYPIKYEGKQNIAEMLNK